MAGIYVHIPFCKQACYYCDFHFSTNQRTRSEMMEAITKELKLQQSYLNKEIVNTIYFGGGTPSLLSSDELKKILDTIYNTFKVIDSPEVSLEGNPDDLSLSKLQQLYTLGINRLSIGIQSFNNEILQFLNRAHNAEAGKNCVHFARQSGFKNISIDLIYAIPNQTDDVWNNDIKQALALNPEHISSYSLTIEEKTVFGRWASKGKLNAVDDEKAAHQLETLVKELEQAGYEQYEVSNFAKQGFYSQHNSSYWKQEKYLGIGPSAHSYNGFTRQYNVSNNYEYLKKISEDEVPATVEALNPEDHVNDYLLTTLRTAWGADLKFLRERFSYNVIDQHNQYLEQLIAGKLATLTNETLILTKRGKLLADKISSDLFLVSGQLSK